MQGLNVFFAIANPTRRRLLDLLEEGERSATALAEHFEVSRPAIAQHLEFDRKF